MVVFVKCRRSASKCFFRSYVFADCGHEDKEKIKQQYCMFLRTAMIVFVKCRRSESKCFFRSYVVADCGHEDKRKCKSNIVRLCGLQWLCLLGVGDLSDLYDLHYLFAGDRRATARTMETFSHAATKKKQFEHFQDQNFDNWKFESTNVFAIGGETLELLHGGQKNVGKHPSGDLRKKAIVDMQHRSQIGYMKFSEHMGTLLNRHLSLRLRLKFLILSSLLQFWLVFMMCPLTSNYLRK